MNYLSIDLTVVPFNQLTGLKSMDHGTSLSLHDLMLLRSMLKYASHCNSELGPAHGDVILTHATHIARRS